MGTTIQNIPFPFVYTQHPALPSVLQYNTLPYNIIAHIGDSPNPCLTGAFQHISDVATEGPVALLVALLHQMDWISHLFHSKPLTGAFSWGQGLQANPSPNELLFQKFLIMLSPDLQSPWVLHLYLALLVLDTPTPTPYSFNPSSSPHQISFPSFPPFPTPLQVLADNHPLIYIYMILLTCLLAFLHIV